MRNNNFPVARYAASALMFFLALSLEFAHAQLYLETFDTSATGGPVTDYGWQADVDTGGIGTFDDTPFGGGDGNVVFVYGNAGDTNALYSNELINIDPTAHTNGITLSIDADPTFNASVASPVSYWAVQIGGSSWFSSVATIGVGDTADSWMTFQYDFDPMAANWNQLTLTGGTGPPTIGAPAAGNLIGNITGIGVVVEYPAAGTHHYDNAAIFIGAQDGDVDGDNDVDLDDFAMIRSNMSKSVTMRSEGDLNRDGLVNLLDFAEWKDNYPFPLSGLGASSVTVPEPSCVLLSVFAMLISLGAGRYSKS